MTMNTISTFVHGLQQYRHGMDYDTDEVFLQRLNPAAKTAEQEWESLLRFDPHCNVFTADKMRIGKFIMDNVNGISRWVYIDDATKERVVGEDTRAVQGLLDTEITISNRWLDKQEDRDSDSARLARHRELHNIGLPPHPEVVARTEYTQLMEIQRNEAVAHLQAILNSHRTATQALETEQSAREWLRSIGSDAP